MKKKTKKRAKQMDATLDAINEDIEAIAAGPGAIKNAAGLVDRMEQAAAAGTARVLGYLCWWEAEGAEAPMSQVVAAVEAALLPKTACPNIEARGGLKKALESLGLRASPQSGKRSEKSKAAKKAKSDEDADEDEEEARLFYDRLVDDSERIVMAIQERVVDNADGHHPVARYVERQTITYDRKSKSVSCSSSFMRDAIQAGFAKYCETYRANEIRTVIQNILDHHAKAIRVRDGLYFVPGGLVEWVEKLRDLAARLDKVKLTKVSILDVAGGEREDMRELAGAAIKGELEALALDLEKIQDRVKTDGVTARDSTYEARLVRFTELREKARVYQDLLAIETSDVEEGLAGLTEKVEALMGAAKKKRR